MVCGELEPAAYLEAFPERVEEERTEKPVRTVLLLRPRIGKEHVDRSRMMRRQKVVERVERLEPEDARVRYPAAATLAREEPHALEHALYPEEVTVRIRLSSRGEEPPLPAANLDFQGT